MTTGKTGTTQNKYAMKWMALLFTAVFINVAAAGSIYRMVNIALIIKCDPGERLEDLQPFSDNNYRDNKFPLVDFYIYDCTPPEKTYAESFKKLNITVTDSVSKITINGMPPAHKELTDGMFKGVPFSNLILIISKIQYTFTTKRNENFSGIKLSDLDDIKIGCKGDTLEKKPRSFFNRTLKMSTNGRMTIRSCPVPKKSYVDFMKQLNLSPDSVRDLELILPPNAYLMSSTFQELVVRKLTLFGESKLRPENNFLDTLSSLDEITFSNMDLPPFPNETNIQTASLKHGESIDAFGGCTKLKKLHLKEWEVPNMSSWLGHCTNLQKMNLDLMSKETVRITLNNLTTVASLNVTNSNIRQLDGSFLANAINLRILNLQKNSLGQIDGDAFKSQSRLEELDLSWNSLTKWDFADYPQLVSLKKLILDRNPLPPLCNNYIYGASTLPLPIEHISARHTEVMTLCLTKPQFDGKRRWENLTFVDFSHNNQRSPFGLDQIAIPHRRDMTIDIRDNPLQGFALHRRYNYMDLVQKFKKAHKLILKTNMLPVDCDCNYGWLGKALRELPHITLEGTVCAEDAYGPSQPIRAHDPKHQECYKFPCNNCTCRMDYYTLQVRADCRKAGLTEIPRNWTFVKGMKITYDVILDTSFTEDTISGQRMNITEILVSGNRIKQIEMDDIPKTVELLDLHNNDIDRVNESVMAAMFELPSRRVLLSGNPIVCDCENRPMIVALSEHRDQVADYTKLRCVGSSDPLSMLSPDDLCDEEHEKQVLIAAVTGASLLALLVAATTLYYRYRQFIKVYFYARGLCLCCVKEEEADADRPFDAFISFAHEDDELVTEKILSYLENDYELCIHTRTWVPGEMIHSQILRSVAESRRTVIILSHNFIKSIWGMVEFKTAYDSALREGRVRVIVVVVDDVIEDEELDPELKGYLKTNTYLKMDDAWFMKKLRYALPHRSRKLVGKLVETDFESERRSTIGRLDSHTMPAINDFNYHVDLNLGEEEHEMMAN